MQVRAHATTPASPMAKPVKAWLTHASAARTTQVGASVVCQALVASFASVATKLHRWGSGLSGCWGRRAAAQPAPDNRAAWPWQCGSLRQASTRHEHNCCCPARSKAASVEGRKVSQYAAAHCLPAAAPLLAGMSVQPNSTTAVATLYHVGTGQPAGQILLDTTVPGSVVVTPAKPGQPFGNGRYIIRTTGACGGGHGRAGGGIGG